jgi:hypothetical protein
MGIIDYPLDSFIQLDLEGGGLSAKRVHYFPLILAMHGKVEWKEKGGGLDGIAKE